MLLHGKVVKMWGYTLIEAPTGIFGCSLRHSQPHHSVSSLLRGPQTFLHGAVEVRHGIGHSWKTQKYESAINVYYTVLSVQASA